MSNGWIGVDLDATLAEYTGWKGEKHVGAPVPAMLQRVKDWIAEGKTVKIMTARVSARDPEELSYNVSIIQDWCVANGLPRLEVTCRKDYAMIELWDDRCKQVVPNTWESLEDKTAKLEAELASVKGSSGSMGWDKTAKTLFYSGHRF